MERLLPSVSIRVTLFLKMMYNEDRIMEDIFAKLYDMTAFSNIIADPSFLVMYAIAFILLLFRYQETL